jgi:hypothetical protein
MGSLDPIRRHILDTFGEASAGWADAKGQLEQSLKDITHAESETSDDDIALAKRKASVEKMIQAMQDIRPTTHFSRLIEPDPSAFDPDLAERLGFVAIDEPKPVDNENDD